MPVVDGALRRLRREERERFRRIRDPRVDGYLDRQCAITLVQHTQSAVAVPGTSTTLAFGSNLTAGNLLVLMCRLGANGTTMTTTDTLGHTWVEAVNVDNAAGGRRTFLRYVENCSGGANTITFTPSTSVTFRIAIFEYSGLLTSGALDQKTATGATGNSTTANSGNLTTTQADELLIGFAERSTSTFVATGGFTIEEAVPAAPNSFLAAMDLIVSATGTYSCGATFASGDWSAGLATFKAAGAGATRVPYQSYYQSIVTQ